MLTRRDGDGFYSRAAILNLLEGAMSTILNLLEGGGGHLDLRNG